ncbi:ABC-ATPase domain-containing protein, partial [Staphylococcus epidermidis]|uniref:ABC-ATPase domain-containing protein n=1 Tax=Staphylococcus epidermidis TaxID=1282 RepID=UPI0037D9EB52
MAGEDKKVSKIEIDSCGEEMLERRGIVIKNDEIEGGIEVGLGGGGGRILGRIGRDRVINV